MLQHTALIENHPASVPKHLTGLRHWFDTGKNGGIVREGDFSKDPSLLSRAELLVAAIYKGVDPGDEIPWKIIQRGYEVLAMSSSNAQVVARTECESDMLLLPAHRIQEVAAGGQSHGVLASGVRVRVWSDDKVDWCPQGVRGDVLTLHAVDIETEDYKHHNHYGLVSVASPVRS